MVALNLVTTSYTFHALFAVHFIVNRTKVTLGSQSLNHIATRATELDAVRFASAESVGPLLDGEWSGVSAREQRTS